MAGGDVMISISNRFISVTKPYPCINYLNRFYNINEQITWRDNADILYKGMYRSTCSSVSTFKVELWS